MVKGYVSFVLHAHLPYVRHPEYENFLEEDWLFEAISETYLPLLDMLGRLSEEGVPCGLMMCMSPPLCSMLRDTLLQERFVHHLDRCIELAEKEQERTKDSPQEKKLADFYFERFSAQKAQFLSYQRDVVGAFGRFQEAGLIEIGTCSATHGFLPLMATQPEAVRAQIQIAVEDYQRHFGRRPRGIWLPECAYYPGLDVYLREAGLRFFFVDSHGILDAQPSPVHGVHAPVYTPSGVAAFGRDPESSRQVWSSKEGYPGDVNYREFYRDLGFDLPFEYIGPYVQPTGARKMTGFKYHRITGESEHKELYDPKKAREMADEHAGNFMFNRQHQVSHLAEKMGRPPIVVAPYDAELFGHWWFEGPWFLEALIRKAANHQSDFAMLNPAEYLQRHPEQQLAQPPFCTWGANGYAEVWLDPSNDWIYPHLHKASERMIQLAKQFPNADGLLRRALNQMARELLLAQSSDWAFIMQTNTSVEYSVRRTNDHLLRAGKLYEQILSETIDVPWLEDIEYRDNIFADIDYNVYAEPTPFQVSAPLQ